MAFVSKSFRDFSLTFDKNAVTDDVLSLTNEAAIKESVKNIVRYNFYEKPFDPAFGGNVVGLLFENATVDLEEEVSFNIEQAINKNEPRVTCYEVVTQFDESNNDLRVQIYYVIEGIPSKLDNLELAFKP